MTQNALTSRLPWHDRWTEPSLDQLLEPLSENHCKHVTGIIEAINGFPRTRSDIIWYGPAWKWTVHFALLDDSSRAIENLCYVVPNQETPLVCFPLTDAFLEHLPTKRLTRYIRDGIGTAKFAVAIHWASWTPNAQSEVDALMDLVKRKHKFHLGPKNGSSNSDTQ